MPDCFISFSSHDERFAKYVAGELRRHSLSAFLASDSLKPGDDWADEIKRNLRNSKWMIFLASRAACQSAWVQQELGMAMGEAKELIPVVWDISPEELPGWAPASQALDLRQSNAEDVRRQITSLAAQLRQDKQKGFAIGAAIVAGLIYLGGRD